jgi:hypothetical protein
MKGVDMYEFSALNLWLSFLITWAVVLIPPAVIRALRDQPLGNKVSITLCVALYFGNIIIFSMLGSQSKSHLALLLGAWFSYYILRWQTEASAARMVASQRKALGYDE